MTNYFREFFDWSEVWATLIPIVIFVIRKSPEPYLKPILFYLCLALLLNIFADVIWKWKHFYPAQFKLYIPVYLWSNNFLYNINSICRLAFFLWFFNRLNFQALRIKNFFVVLIVCVMIIVNFRFESFTEFSSFTFSSESIILLTYTLSYFLFLIKEDELRTDFEPSLFIVTGIAVYEAANFFIFLFHKALLVENSEFSAAIWKLSNIYYIILCLYFAKAFYGGRKNSLLPITIT